MSGTPPIVQTEHVDEHMARVYVSSTVPARYVDYDQLPVGAPHPMVSIANSWLNITYSIIPREDCRGGLCTTSPE
jgi:hypothetical protein